MKPNENIKPIMICNLFGHKKGTGYAYSVYSVEGICATINTMGGGGREPMIVEVEDEQDNRSEGSRP